MSKLALVVVLFVFVCLMSACSSLPTTAGVDLGPVGKGIACAQDISKCQGGNNSAPVVEHVGQEGAGVDNSTPIVFDYAKNTCVDEDKVVVDGMFVCVKTIVTCQEIGWSVYSSNGNFQCSGKVPEGWTTVELPSK